MKFSIKTKLLAMCIGLVLFMTLSLASSYYVIAKRDKHRESQERIQIAFDIVLDDIAEHVERYRSRIHDFLRQGEDTLYLASRIYGSDTSRPTVGVDRTYITSYLTRFGQSLSIDRMMVYGENHFLLAWYQRRPDPVEEMEPGRADEPLEISSVLPPDGIASTFDLEFPAEMVAELFTQGQRLGIRIIAPLSRDDDVAGVLVGDKWITREMAVHYSSLSKTAINFFAGDLLGPGTLLAQQKLAPEVLRQSIACEELPPTRQGVETFSVMFAEHKYYQGRCALHDTTGVIGAMTVSLSQAIEAREMQNILTVVVTIAGIGIVICIILVSGILVPRFTDPIITLTQVSLHMAKGELEQEIDTSGTDELGILAQGFAHMRDEMKKKIKELHQLNDELEQRVKRRTAQLQREKYILDTFLATVPDRIYFKDRQGRITRANRAHAARFGFTDPSEEIGKTDFDIFAREMAQFTDEQKQDIHRSGQRVFSQETAQYNYEHEQEILHTGQPVINYECSVFRPDDTLEWWLATKMPLRDEHGTIIGTFGISRDITELKHTAQELAQYRNHLEELVEERAGELIEINVRLHEEICERTRIEEALRAGEAQYRTLAENVMDGIIIVQKRHLVFANVAFAVITGTRMEELAGHDPVLLFHKRSQGCARVRLAGDDAIFPDPRWQAEIMTTDGRVLWTEIDQTKILWNGASAILLTLRDITDRKMKERQLKNERKRLQLENVTLRSAVTERYKFGQLVGKSAALQQVYELIVSAAASEVNVLICGESGTGKELIAQTIHQISRRKSQACVPVNCASIPEPLFEREFFGHRKGAFTGANRDKPGLFDLAHRGTLFLDEVTELTPGAQAKLLRVLQDGDYLPLGEPTRKQADAMIVAATNADWKTLIEQGALRRDFFYRICVIEIISPPLRERKEDLPLLIEYFLERYRQKQEKIHGGNVRDIPLDQTMLPGEFVQMLYAYDWPGNIRELQNVLRRYLATRDIASAFSLADMPKDVRTVSIDINPQGILLPDVVKNFEKQIIANMLAGNQNHTGKTAGKLGIARRTLQQKIKQYQLPTHNGA